MDKLKKLGIVKPRGAKDKYKTLCPKCSHLRKKHPDEPCLSVSENMTCKDGVLCTLVHCQHCGWTPPFSSINDRVLNDSSEQVVLERREQFEIPNYAAKGANKKVIDFFKRRKIDADIISLYDIGYDTRLIKRGSKPEPVISFPFYKNGEIINVQFQTFPDKRGDKVYRMMPGAELSFYGLDDMVEDGFVAFDKLIIVEGLKDKLAFRQVGFKNVVSVPNGAPDPSTTDYRKALSYLDDPAFQKILENIKQIVVATDGDVAGRRLAEMMVERLGAERCLKVEYPKGDINGRPIKDAGDILIELGEEELIDFVLSAKPYPVNGIIEVEDITDKLLRLHETGITPGYSTGIIALDAIITIKPGYLYPITGIPGVGKTEFVNWLTEGLANRENIHITLFSPESFPIEEHISKIAQIHTNIPFGMPDDDNRMSQTQLMEAAKWVNKHFTWIMPEKRSNAQLLSLAKAMIIKHGTKVVVIDPFTEVETEGENEHKFIKDFLSDWLYFARTNNVAILIVVHPTKELKPRQDDGEYPIVTPTYMNGSSHWHNKTDFIISLWRSVRDENNILRIYVVKAKIKQVGRASYINYVELQYDNETGVFYEVESIVENRAEKAYNKRLLNRKKG